MKVLASTLAVLAGLAAGSLAAQPLDTAFTYQGRLQDAGAPANGPYDFRFILFDAPVGGSQIGPIVFRDDIVLADGLFTVSLDFGAAAFTGNKRWLDIAIRPGPSGGSYTALSERQELQAAPHSAFSLRTPWAGIAGKPAGFADDIDNDALVGLACASGQVAKWNGTAWACAADASTTYSAGAGLDLTGTVFSVADLGVTAPKIANLAVGTAKLADGAVTSAKIADGTVATADIASGAVTSGIIADGAVALADLGQNGCGPNQILKWSGTAWACANDLDTNSGGTVTSVATGSGLTGGPITGAGTLAVAGGGITTALIADGAVTSPKIAGGAVGLAQINTGEVQARVAMTCPAGQYLRGINANGAVVCEAVLAPNVISTVEYGGFYTSLAIGADGLPVISYTYSDINGTLRVSHCGNPACSAGNTLATIDFGGPGLPVGTYSSIAIGADGLPVISYYDGWNSALKVAHCGDVSCSAVSLVTVDNTASVGEHSSIAIGTDGRPVISYYDATATALKVAHCADLACTVVDTPVTADNGASVGQYSSIAIGTDGRPVISYYDATATALKVAHCANVACTVVDTPVTADNGASVGQYSSIAIGTDGRPVISYYDASATALKVAHCANVACTVVDTPVTVDDAASVGEYTSIAIGTDGYPVVSYRDATASALRLVRCGNATCSAGNSIIVVDDPFTSLVGGHTSVALAADSLPIISYQDSTAFTLKVAKCATRTCQ